MIGTAMTHEYRETRLLPFASVGIAAVPDKYGDGLMEAILRGAASKAT